MSDRDVIIAIATNPHAKASLMRCAPLLALFAVVAVSVAAPLAAFAAELPLGVVEQGDAQQVVLRFDPSVRLLPGAMVAIYGPGRVEKHPLTKAVIVEARALVAKAQVIGMQDMRLRARITWSSSAPTAGMDVVPLPTEAAPNAAPVLTGEAVEISAAVEATVRVQLPLSDPDGDTMSIAWNIESASGQGGTLGARLTTLPENTWTAPGKAGEATLVVTARDVWGQELVTKVRLIAKADDEWHKREPKSFARFGAVLQPGATRLTRDADGGWWGLDEHAVALHHFNAGWLLPITFAFAADKAPRRPVAVRVFRKELLVLDAKRAGVLVFGMDGNPKRDFGAGSSPTDFAIAADGTVFIADQGAGGVLVHEANGAFRARLGMPGVGDQGFEGLTRIALAAGGELYCLDPALGQIARFDRFQRRLDTWKLQIDARNLPVDLALHPRGVLVLLANGVVQVLNAKGQATEAWKGLGEAGLTDRPGAASGLFVDTSGEVLVAYPDYGLIARHQADGIVSGVRGPGLWALAHFAADGLGRLHGLDTDLLSLNTFDAEGWKVARFGSSLKTGGHFVGPVAVATTPDGSAVVVLDGSAMNVVRYTGPKDKPLVFAQPGKNGGQFQDPIGIAMDAEGRTYVLDAKQHRVQVFDAKGAFLFSFGRYEKGKQADELPDPRFIAVSPAGDAAYVYEDDTYEVKKFALDFTKLQGIHVNNAGGKGDGPGQFRAPLALACDRLGLLYVADGGRGDVQVLDFRGSNAVAGTARKAADLGIKRIERFVLAPDGQFYVGGSANFIGWRW